ncbi:MAG: Uma2 family endonuclease [Anaerolineae bacterium]|nr:Uma2 family endonuclease [Anaerolineae bacterium]
MVAARHHIWTVAQYLDYERGSNVKHEFLDGSVYAMTGASKVHNTITFNLGSHLGPQMRGRGCQGFASDMRVRTPSGLYAYPDMSIVCGTPDVVKEVGQDTLCNPTVLFEILSPSTQAYDRGEKFRHYRSLPSLQAYVLISQSEPHIEHYARQSGDSWLLSEANGLAASVALESIGCTLSLGEIYLNVDFDTQP